MPARAWIALFSAPQSPHAAFRATTKNSLCEAVESRLLARCLKAPRRNTLNAWANYCRLPSGELWFCSYGDPITLKFADSDYLRIQFQYNGEGATRCGAQVTPVTAAQACISSAAATIDFGSGFQQLVWRVRRDAVSRKLAALLGQTALPALDFKPEMHMASAQTAGLVGLLGCTLQNAAHAGPRTPAFLLEELEQALIVSLLSASEHNWRQALDAGVSPSTPWQVRRVEEYIEANWDKPFKIEDVVALTGSSARTIHRYFQRTRGYSPKEFLKQRRLAKARELLCSSEAPRTLIDVALACGFNDLSHFSRDFSRTFGEPPSAVRKARR